MNIPRDPTLFPWIISIEISNSKNYTMKATKSRRKVWRREVVSILDQELKPNPALSRLRARRSHLVFSQAPRPHQGRRQLRPSPLLTARSLIARILSKKRGSPRPTPPQLPFSDQSSTRGSTNTSTKTSQDERNRRKRERTRF